MCLSICCSGCPVFCFVRVMSWLRVSGFCCWVIWIMVWSSSLSGVCSVMGLFASFGGVFVVSLAGGD